MDIITADTMRSLVDEQSRPCVSIYMPTHRAGRETRQDPIRLGNLVARARDELVATGMRPPEAGQLLGAFERLTVSETFWQQQEDGLALFTCPGRTEWFRLPSSFDEMAVVAGGFHVKPLWPLVDRDHLFYILALSRNHVRLLWANRFRIGPVDLPEEIPDSLAEALWYDDAEKQLQHRAISRAGGGRVVAEFHGHGVPEEKSQPKLEAFLRSVDGGVAELIEAEAPLLLAGVEDITAHYRQVSDHRAIVDAVIGGNPDGLSEEELHRQAIDIMQPRLQTSQHDDAAAFMSAKADVRSSDVEPSLHASLTGRVSVLFLPIGNEVWGVTDAAGEKIEIHGDRKPGDRDLLDLMGVAAWSHGGRLHVVKDEDMPGDGPVAALFRF